VNARVYVQIIPYANQLEMSSTLEYITFKMPGKIFHGKDGSMNQKTVRMLWTPKSQGH
jgi:hypothetical protein